MATGTLVDHSLGTAIESTWNVEKTPDHFYEWLDSSGLDLDPNIVQGKGLRVGSRFPRAGRRVQLIPIGSGHLDFELASKGFGSLLQAAGGTATSTVVAGPLYQQVITAVTSTTTLPTLTCQEGIVRADGNVDAYTWRGCSVMSLEIAVPMNGIATTKATIDARAGHKTRSVSDGVTNSTTLVTSATANFAPNDVGAVISGAGITSSPVTTIAAVLSSTNITLSQAATATASGVALTIGLAYATPSYPSTPTLYNSASPSVGALVIGGTLTVPTATALASIAGGTTAIGLKAWTFTLDNGVDTKRDVLGGRNQSTTGERKGTLKTTIEYDAVTGALLEEAMMNQTQLSLLLTATTPEVISAGNNATFQIAVPVAAIDKGAIPQPTDGKVVSTDVMWTLLDGLVSQTLYLVLRTADTAL